MGREVFYTAEPTMGISDSGVVIHLSDRREGIRAVDGNDLSLKLRKLDLERVPYNQLEEKLQQIEGVDDVRVLIYEVNTRLVDGVKKAQVFPYKIYLTVFKQNDVTALLLRIVKVIANYLDGGDGVVMTESLSVKNVISGAMAY